MLTENEREWLLRRSKKAMFCATWCSVPLLDCCDACAEGSCPTRGGDMEDAAEFSERVAAKLAAIFDASTEIAPLCPSCPCEDDCYDGKLKCKAAILKYARLAVEEEMDDDMDI